MILKAVRQVKRALFSQRPANLFYYGNHDRSIDLRTDEYVRWLSRIIGGYLDEGNVEAFEYCIRQMPSAGSVVEIGAFLGLSTNIIAYAAHKYQRANPFFACDPWDFAGYGKTFSGYFNNGTKEYRSWVKEICKMNISLFSSEIRPSVIETSSDKFFERWKTEKRATDIFGRDVQLGGAISFAYVDGDHSYESVKKDFLNVDQHLSPGGFLLLDDSADNSTFDGVKQLTAEITANARYELVLKTPNYCFRRTE
jgi:hypothetical protein